jgi:cyclopropane fatty-acyl-phospholipid synthase-like methyltransferase
VNASTTSAEFFEQKYRENADPWDFARSEYEQSRYGAIIAALGERRYERAFEPGCSVGELTWRLASHCEHVDAMDISATAIDRAKLCCSGLPNVTLRVGGLPHHIPEGSFDLIVFSEIGYYFDEARLQELGKSLVDHISSSGTLLAAHWLGTSKDHVLSGDRVHEVLGGLDGLRLNCTKRYEKFRLDRWERV